jgi:hypothetical protein
MRTLLACLVVTLAVFGSSCASSPQTSPEVKALTTARNQFKGTPRASYTFTWQMACFCSPTVSQPIRITVADGAIASAVYVDTQQPVDASIRGLLKTIDEVFALIQQAIDADYDEVSVSYDSQVGFPSRVSLNQNGVPDAGTHLTLTGFTLTAAPSDGGSSGTPGGSGTGGEGGW